MDAVTHSFIQIIFPRAPLLCQACSRLETVQSTDIPAIMNCFPVGEKDDTVVIITKQAVFWRVCWQWMPQRKSSREVGSGDSFEAGVKTGLTEKMALEQRLEAGGA